MLRRIARQTSTKICKIWTYVCLKAYPAARRSFRPGPDFWWGSKLMRTLQVILFALLSFKLPLCVLLHQPLFNKAVCFSLVAPVHPIPQHSDNWDKVFALVQNYICCLSSLAIVRLTFLSCCSGEKRSSWMYAECFE